MPQALSKCRHPLSSSFSLSCNKVQVGTRLPYTRKKFKCKKKSGKQNYEMKMLTVPVQASQGEDWEKEIEEFSRCLEDEKEKATRNQDPYGAEDTLNMALGEMSLYNIPNAPHLDKYYTPSVHHYHPVKWIRPIYSTFTEQFADAEE